MSKIAEKLREAYHNDLTDVPLLIDAAEEIERLRAELVEAKDTIENKDIFINTAITDFGNMQARAERVEAALAKAKASTKRLRSDMQSCIDRQGGMLIDAAKEIVQLREAALAEAQALLGEQ